MDLSVVLARLKAQLTGFKQIGTSVDMEIAMKGAPPTPCAFVLPLAESAANDDLTGMVHAQVAQAFGVVLCVSNVRDARAAAALTDLTPLRAQVRTALLGYVPDPANAEPVHYKAGRLMQLDGDGRLWWLDEFEVTTHYWST